MHSLNRLAYGDECDEYQKPHCQYLRDRLKQQHRPTTRFVTENSALVTTNTVVANGPKAGLHRINETFAMALSLEGRIGKYLR